MRNNDEYKTQRPLFKKYFDENVAQFFYRTDELLDAEGRRKLILSDEKFSKLINRYI